MEEDFATLPPTRFRRRPEDVGKTDAEVLAAERERISGPTEHKPPPPPMVWEPGRPSDPRVLALLRYPHSPTGQPLSGTKFREPPPPPPGATDAELTQHMGRRFRMYQEWEDAEQNAHARFVFWCGLDANSRTQLAADCLYGGTTVPDPTPEDPQRVKPAPMFLCSCEDGGQPPVVLRAESHYRAMELYQQLLGITSTVHKFFAVPYEPAA